MKAIFKTPLLGILMKIVPFLFPQEETKKLQALLYNMDDVERHNKMWNDPKQRAFVHNPSGLITNINTYKGSLYYSGIADSIEEFGISGRNMDELIDLGEDIGSTQNWSKLYRKNHTPLPDVGYHYSQFVDRGKLNIRDSNNVSSPDRGTEPYIVSSIGNNDTENASQS